MLEIVPLCYHKIDASGSQNGIRWYCSQIRKCLHPAKFVGQATPDRIRDQLKYTSWFFRVSGEFIDHSTFHHSPIITYSLEFANNVQIRKNSDVDYEKPEL